MINYYRLSAPSQKEMPKRPLFPLKAPTLVIWGERDGYLGPELAEPDRDDVPNLDRVERLADAVALGAPRRGGSSQQTAHRLLRPALATQHR